MSDLHNLYRESLSTLCVELKALIDKGTLSHLDWIELKEKFHKFSGESSMLGFSGLANISRGVESIAKEKCASAKGSESVDVDLLVSVYHVLYYRLENLTDDKGVKGSDLISALHKEGKS